MPAQPAHLLVIGYGSPLRGDDAAGLVLAEELDGDEGLTCVAVHQLTPDLAARIAGAGEVVFVDAVAREEPDLLPGDFLVSPASTGLRASVLSHGSTPEALLELAGHLYGHRPPATVIGIPAVAFDLGASLSRMARAGIDAAKAWIRQRRACHA